MQYQLTVPSPPTHCQQEIAAFLDSEVRRRGIMPTQREIAARFGYASLNSVRSHLRLMGKKGMVVRLPGKARGIRRPVPTRPEGIPLLGKIAAGTPVLAVQNADEFVPVPPELFSGDELFALRVSGESMTGAGILPGDIAILNRQQAVAEGDIAAVLREDEATLKYFYRRRGSIVLRGANPAFADIVIPARDAQNLRILGRYVGLIRKEGGRA